MANHLIPALAQLLTLMVLSVLAARAYRASVAKQALVTLLLLWVVLSTTAYLLAIFSLLGNPWVYAATSVGIGAAVIPVFWLLARRMSAFTPPGLSDATAPSALPLTSDRIDRGLLTGSLIAVAAAVAASSFLAAYYYPTNDDSLTYRFPRVMYYLSQGNLNHFETYDPRLVFYPLCSVFLYFLPGSWALDGRSFNFISISMWLAGGTAVIATSRQIGSSRTAGCIAAALYLTAPAVLISASSTNDDMIAGVPMLCCILFGLCWWRSRSVVDAVLSGIGAGLSVGTKFHILLYDVAGLLLIVVVMVRPALRTLAWATIRSHWRHLLAASAVAAYFVLPGLAINLLQGHTLLPPRVSQEFSPFNDIVNAPFSFKTGIINVAISLTQLFLSDLPNTLFFVSESARLHVIVAYDAIINRSLLWWLPGPAEYAIAYYQFRGVTSPIVGLSSSEASVTLGLLPWLLAIAIYISARMRLSRAGAAVVLCLSASLLIRFVSFGMHFRYGDSAGIYGAFAIAVAAPALAWTWDARKCASAPVRAVIVVLWCAALLVNVAIGIDSFAGNPARNLKQVASTGFSGTQGKPVSPKLAAALSAMKRIDVIYTHYEIEAFSMMMANMSGRYTSRLYPFAEPGHSELYSYPLNSRYGNVPLLVADDGHERLRMLGTYAGIGQEVVFGTGDLPGGEEQGGYVVMRMVFDEAPDDGEIVQGLGVVALVGTRPDDDFEYSLVQITPSHSRRLLLPWTSAGGLPGKITAEILQFGRAPTAVSRVALAEPTNQGYVAVRLRHKTRPDLASETWVPLDRTADIMPPQASVHDYRLKTTINFKAGGDGSLFTVAGWSTAEAPGTWSVGGESVLDVRLATAPAKPLRLEAKVAPFLVPGQAREEVTVIANGVAVATWVFEEGGWATRTADIPLAILAGQRSLQLVFVSDTTVAPAKIGLSIDPRPLKLLFETASLAEVTETSPSQTGTTAYSLGQILSFTASGQGNRFTGDGWSTPEAAGTWSIGKVSSLRFTMQPPPQAPLHLVAHVLPFVPPGKTTSVRVLANGKLVATWDFKVPGWTDVSATLPIGLLGPDGSLDLQLTVASVASPAAIGAGADLRELKLLFQQVALSP